MSMNFPDNPSLNQIFSNGAHTWKWNGATWDLVVGGGLAYKLYVQATQPSGQGESDGDVWIKTT